MKFRIFTRGDVDGFFGLMLDNLIQILVLSGLCIGLGGMSPEFLATRVLPGVAISLLFGNILYALQAFRLAKSSSREDVTALPYGINTVSLFAFFFFVIFPIYKATGDSIAAWKVGLLASFTSGLIEIAGSFVADKIRKNTPRAALLSALAGIAITFISMDFLVRTFQNPMVAFLPFSVLLLQYFGKFQFPFHIPGGLISIALGIFLAYVTPYFGFPDITKPFPSWDFHLYLPLPALQELWETLSYANFLAYFAVIFPMGIFNVIGSLQNIESAEASGDSYSTRNSLLINGSGTLLGAFFGSPFPTTIYIGHPGWKALGAKHGYSILNGLFITGVILLGGVSILESLIPIEAGMGIVLWIGIVIAAQCFQSVPSHHAPAVVVGLLPALAGWAVLLLQNAFNYLQGDLSQVDLNAPLFPYPLGGILALSQGFLVSSMVWASIVVQILDSQWRGAGIWALVGALLSLFGCLHSFSLIGNSVQGSFSFPGNLNFVWSYLLLSVFFFLVSLSSRKVSTGPV